jgi:regulator of sigma E protease
MNGSYVELLQTFSGNLFISALAFLGSLTVVVALHEFGHYFTARLCNVRIQKFSLGFGKEIIGFTDKHGTRWSLSRIPLGGYVQIFGDVDHEKPEIYDSEKKIKRPLTPEEIKEAFFAKSVWKRILIVAAGPIINFLLAVLIFATLFHTIGQVATPAVVGSVALGTSGYEAGFRPFDEIISMDGKPVERFEEVWEHTKKNIGVPYHFKVKRNNQIIDIIVASRLVEYTDEQGIPRTHGRMGATHITAMRLKDIISFNDIQVDNNTEKARQLVLKNLGKNVRIGALMSKNDSREDVFLVHIFPETNKDLSNPKSKDYDKVFFWKTKERFLYRYPTFFSAFNAGCKYLAELIREALTVLGVLLTGQGSQQDLGGVVTIGGMAGKAAQDSFYAFFLFIAVMSAQVGFINMLPVPVLDGGYLVFLIYEVMSRKRVPERIKELALYGGMVFLFGIMIIANLNDIFRMTHP